MWQRLASLKISCDFSVMGSVTRKRGSLDFSGLSEGIRRVEIICLMLTTSKPSSVSTSQISSAGMTEGRCLITTLTGFWDFGKKEKRMVSGK
jgi:hypothetical protein